MILIWVYMQILNIPISHKSPILAGLSGIFDHWKRGISEFFICDEVAFLALGELSSMY